MLLSILCRKLSSTHLSCCSKSNNSTFRTHATVTHCLLKLSWEHRGIVFCRKRKLVWFPPISTTYTFFSTLLSSSSPPYVICWSICLCAALVFWASGFVDLLGILTAWKWLTFYNPKAWKLLVADYIRNSRTFAGKYVLKCKLTRSRRSCWPCLDNLREISYHVSSLES